MKSENIDVLRIFTLNESEIIYMELLFRTRNYCFQMDPENLYGNFKPGICFSSHDGKLIGHYYKSTCYIIFHTLICPPLTPSYSG